MKIFCDLDGVLTDFEGRFKKLFKQDIGSFKEKYGEAAAWSEINKYKYDFWFHMPWMPDGKRLWKYIKQFNPIILSAIPSYKLSRYAIKGKEAWLKHNLGYDIRYHICRRYDKVRLCTPASILIDDYPTNVDEWRSRAGIGILHTTANSTIKLVAKLKTNMVDPISRETLIQYGTILSAVELNLCKQLISSKSLAEKDKLSDLICSVKQCKTDMLHRIEGK